jgi:phage-related tail protein
VAVALALAGGITSTFPPTSGCAASALSVFNAANAAALGGAGAVKDVTRVAGAGAPAVATSAAEPSAAYPGAALLQGLGAP